MRVWDNAVALLARESDDVLSINKKVGIGKQVSRPDEDLLPYLRDALSELGEKLIVVHLIGSHGNYCIQVPDTWHVYRAKLELSTYGKVVEITNQKRVNCYDNSIRYNDHILDIIFSSLEKSRIPASALYFADHSEEVFNGKAHNSANFDFSMSEIPLVFAASESWRKQFPGHWQQLVENRKKIFTNDLIFETVLGLTGLESGGIDTKNDLGHKDFDGVVMPRTLHGKKNLKDESNYNLWQQINADLIRKNNLDSRLYPHRVNTLGKMLEIANRGIRSFETDVFFRSKGGYFEVGHHEGAMTGMALESFLEKVPGDFERIWLDVKDVTDAAVPGINKRLLELDKKFELKSRVIVETANESSAPAQLSESGFHLSYYLPTEETLAVMEKNVRSRKNLAEKIAGIAKAQNAGAVSFDLRLYKFVKEYLEAELGSQVVYHTWFPGVSFENSNLLEEMQAREYFHDSKVNSISLPYASQFSL